MKPVDHVSFRELLRSVEHYLPAGDRRVHPYQVYRVLKLVTKTERPARLVEAAPGPDSLGKRLVFHPIKVTIKGRIARLDLNPVHQLKPPLPRGFECGAGTNAEGLQLDCALRGRLVLGSREAFLHGNWLRAATLTSGFSKGRYNGTAWNDKLPADGPAAADLEFAAAYWWNTDLGVEWRTRAFVARVFLGLAVLLNPSDYTVVKRSSDDFVDRLCGNEIGCGRRGWCHPTT